MSRRWPRHRALTDPPGVVHRQAPKRQVAMAIALAANASSSASSSSRNEASRWSGRSSRHQALADPPGVVHRQAPNRQVATAIALAASSSSSASSSSCNRCSPAGSWWCHTWRSLRMSALHDVDAEMPHDARCSIAAAATLTPDPCLHAGRESIIFTASPCIHAGRRPIGALQTPAFTQVYSKTHSNVTK